MNTTPICNDSAFYDASLRREGRAYLLHLQEEFLRSGNSYEDHREIGALVRQCAEMVEKIMNAIDVATARRDSYSAADIDNALKGSELLNVKQRQSRVRVVVWHVARSASTDAWTYSAVIDHHGVLYVKQTAELYEPLIHPKSGYGLRETPEKMQTSLVNELDMLDTIRLGLGHLWT